MKLEQRRQAMLQLHLSDKQFYHLLRCVSYIRDFTVHVIAKKGWVVMIPIDSHSIIFQDALARMTNGMNELHKYQTVSKQYVP